MDRFFMLLKMAPCCCLIVTVLTEIANSFMDIFLMFLQITFVSCLVPAVFTGIRNTFMFTAGVKIQTPLTFITCLTFLTYLSAVGLCDQMNANTLIYIYCDFKFSCS